jgi:Mrp family chromosome partitioning ATPase/uncharacterized protein involved in exopolysaccharide biosynthesis
MEQTTAKGRGLRPFISLSRHWRWSGLLAIVLFFLGTPLVWVKGQSQYNAEAVFQVSPIYQKNLSGDKELEIQSNAQYREFVSHLSKTVVRWDIVENALQKLKEQQIQACMPAEPPRRCLERIQRTVYVLPVGESYMVRVGFTSSEKDLPDKLINAIMTVFIATVRNEQIFGADERFEFLREQNNKLRTELDDFVSRRSELASSLGLTTFTDTVVNPYDNLLAATREKHSQAKVELSQATSALTAFKSLKEVPIASGRSVLDMRLQDSGLQTLRNEVIKRSEELNRSLAGLETKHPATQALKVEREEIQERLAMSEKSFDRHANENIQARLNASVLQATLVEQELAARVDVLTGKAGWYAAAFREAMELTHNIRKREQELSEIRDRSNFIQTEKSALGFVRLVTPALPASTPQGPGKTMLLLVLIGVCSAVFLIFPTLRDLMDRRVMVVSDAEKAMEMPCAAWIVNKEDASCDVLARDQIQRFGSTLLRLKKNNANSIFAFTSVNVGGGVTGLTLALAHVLQRQGSNVLLVDSNSLAGAIEDENTAATGLVDYLMGKADLDSVVTKRDIDGSSVSYVPYGRNRSCGIVRLDLLQLALTSWSENYDFVLVDLPPLLPSADAALLADMIGQVFVVVEAMSVKKIDVIRARQQLMRQKVLSVGLVVNRVPFWFAESGIEDQLIEQITRSRTDRFMSGSWLGLQAQLWRLQLQKIWLRISQKLRKS